MIDFLQEMMEKNPSIGVHLTELKKADEEEKEKTIHLLGRYCEELGIKYEDGMNMDWRDIRDAHAMAIDCSGCTYTIDNCDDCRHNSETGVFSKSQNRYMSNIPNCEKYAAKCRQLKAQRIVGMSGIGKRFALRRFDTFNVTQETSRAFTVCKDFCFNFSDTRKGIRLYGKYGCGKTHLAASIIHELAEQGIAGVFVVVPELLNKIRRSFSNPSEDTDKIIRTAKEAKLLIMDDLGAEKPSDWVSEQLYMIINSRYEDMLPTIITTNCNTKELIERLGERTVSRIIEMTEPVTIKAIDYRLKSYLGGKTA